MKICKKILSLLLSALMILSIFSGISITSFASETVLPGDADGDGYTTSADARIILRISAKLENGEKDITVYDMNNDGKITAADARHCLRYSSYADYPEYEIAPLRTSLDAERSSVVKLNVTSHPYVVGQEFTVKISASNATGLKSANLFLTYDSTAFEYVSLNFDPDKGFTPSGTLYENGKIAIGLMYLEASTESEIDIAQLTLRAINDDAAPVECTIGTWEGTDVPEDAVCSMTDFEFPSIALGETKEVTTGIDNVGFEFIPEETGTYIYYSESDVDPVGMILDENKNIIAEGDQSEECENYFDFRITANLEAGKTYYLYSYNVLGDSGTYNVSITKAPSTKLLITTSVEDIYQYQTFEVVISASGMKGLQSADLEIVYDPYHLEFVNIRQAETSSAYLFEGSYYSSGLLNATIVYDGTAAAENDDLAVITFKARRVNDSAVTVTPVSWTGTETPLEANRNIDVSYLPDSDINVDDVLTVGNSVSESIIVTVKATDFIGAMSGDLRITYDTDRLEYISHEDLCADENARFYGTYVNPGDFTYSFAFIDSATEDTDLVAIKFRVLQHGGTSVSVAINSWDTLGTTPSDARLGITTYIKSGYDNSSSLNLRYENIGEESYETLESSLIFIPEETARYTFSSVSEDDIDPSGFIYDVNMNLIASNDDYNGTSDFSVSADLTQNNIYYLVSMLDGTTISASYDVTLKKELPLTYTIENGEVTITGYDGYIGGSLEIPETIEGYPVVAIADNAFSNTDITNIVIPASVKSIGNGAFSGCYNLWSVSLTDGLESIGNYAFTQTYLDSIHIPETVRSIGYGCFNHCYSLSYITVDENNTAYTSDDDVLYNKDKTELIRYPEAKYDPSYTIPSTVKKIAPYAFSETNNISTIVFSGNVEEIAEYAFLSSEIRNVTISSNVKTIGESAFEDCYLLLNLRFENGVTSIGNNAFSGCYNLTNVSIPESITAISDRMFFNCFELHTISLPATIKTIGEYAFSNCAFTSVVIPDSVESIGAYAYDRCYGISNVSLGSALKTIGTFAFSGCYELKEVFIPASVTTIEEKAFGYDHGKDNYYLEEFVIEGYSSSEAERYANDNAFIFRDPFCEHTETEIRNVVEVTCTSGGYSGDTYCKNCSALISTGNVIEATGHNNEHKTTPATCIATGEEYDECINCGEISNKKEIPLAECTFGDWNVTTPATCTQEGLKVRTCTVCAKEESEVIAKKDHNLEHVTIPSTCTVAGMEYDICTECDETFNSKTLSLADHTIVTIPGKAATCTQKGLSDGAKCSVCGVVTAEQKEIAAKGHSFGEWKTTKEATYINEGEKTRECSCGEKQTEKIAKLAAEKEAVDKSSNIAVKFTNDTYNGEMKVTADKQFDGSSYQILNNEKGKFKNTLFDITTTVNGNKVQPDGMVLVGIPLPEGYNAKETIVYYVASDGLKKMNSYYENGMIWFETDHFSAYALVDESSEKPSYAMGDVNGDGKITAADARLVLRVSAKLDKLSQEAMAVADATKDNKITAADARLILRVSAKLEKFK